MINPMIREYENPYSRWWYNGLLVGLVLGLAIATAVIELAMWAGLIGGNAT